MEHFFEFVNISLVDVLEDFVTLPAVLLKYMLPLKPLLLFQDRL
jgi:hypothetical protein